MRWYRGKRPVLCAVAEAFYGVDDKLKIQAKSYLDEFLISMTEGFEEAFVKY